jgi:hypothetical protein
MKQIPAPCVGIGTRRLLAQMAAVLDPFVAEHGGEPTQLIRPDLRRAWRDEFAAELPEPALSRCAQAISDGHPWPLALWSDDYATAPATEGPAQGARRDPRRR